MATPIHVADLVDMLVVRNCINNNLVNAENFATPTWQYLQLNYWGEKGVVGVYGRIYADPPLRLPCGQEIIDWSLSTYPSTIRLGTMMNRRTVVGGRVR